MRLKFLEGKGASHRVISSGSSFGHAMRFADGSTSDVAKTITSINGREGYVVKIELTNFKQKL